MVSKKAEEKHRFIFKPGDEFKSKFDLIIMALAIYNCFSIPLSVAFEPEQMKSVYFTIADIIIDLTFVLDIIISFRTAYINNQGNVIDTPTLIAKQYFKDQFWIDLFATLPFDQFAELIVGEKNILYQFFGIMKMGRVLRINKIIQFLNVDEDVKASMKLLKILFFLIIYVHSFCCIWWLIVKQSKSWIPYKDMGLEDMY